MAAEAGHNSELTPEQRKALFMQHYKPIAAQLEKVRAEQAVYKKLRKLAKADKVALWEIDYGLKCAEIDDETILVHRLHREAEIASWFALPIDFQPDMFGSFDREPGVDRARREGKAAGATGKGSNPYDEHSEMGKAWAEEWTKEQKVAGEALQAAMEKRMVKDDGDPGFDNDNPLSEAAE